MRRVTCLALACLLFLPAVPAPASEIREAVYTHFTANVTLVTTAETVVVSSGPVTTTFETHRVIILAWAQLTTGTNTTAVTPRIRRGTTTSGTLVSEANAITIGAAAGSNEQFYAAVIEDRQGQAAVEYSLTLEQAGASANGTALQGGILVLLL